MVSEQGKKRLRLFLMINSILFFLVFSLLYVISGHDKFDRYRLEVEGKFFTPEGKPQKYFKSHEDVARQRLIAEVLANVFAGIFVWFNFVMLLKVILFNGKKQHLKRKNIVESQTGLTGKG